MNNKVSIGYQNSSDRIFYRTGDIVKENNNVITTHVDNDPKISLQFNTEDFTGDLYCPKFDDHANIDITSYRLWTSEYEQHLVLPDPNDENDSLKHTNSVNDYNMNSDCFKINSNQYHIKVGCNNGNWQIININFNGDLGDPKMSIGFYKNAKNKDILYLGRDEKFNISIQESSLS